VKPEYAQGGGLAVACPDDYRSSHATADAAIEYERTYEAGYYAALWSKLAHFADGERRFHAMVSRHFARS